jgi:hypothetical protein
MIGNEMSAAGGGAVTATGARPVVVVFRVVRSAGKVDEAE